MAENRYLKLNCNWDESEWIDPLPDGAKLAWVHVMTYVKAFGFNGRAKARPLAKFAREKGMSVESFELMIAAAKVHGALVEEDGAWRLVTWKKHQGDTTNAERQARFREDHKDESNALSDEGNALQGGSNADSNAKGEERKGEERREDLPPRQPSASESPSGGDGDLSKEEQAERWRVHDFWHRAAQVGDPVVVGLCNAAFSVRKFKFVAPPSLAEVERVVKRAREKAPGDHAILAEIDRFGAYWRAQKRIKGAGHWWLAFDGWCGKCGGKWEIAKLRGGLVSVDGGKSKSPEQMIEEGRQRAKEMLG